jgi:hypothetical protein
MNSSEAQDALPIALQARLDAAKALTLIESHVRWCMTFQVLTVGTMISALGYLLARFGLPGK